MSAIYRTPAAERAMPAHEPSAPSQMPEWRAACRATANAERKAGAEDGDDQSVEGLVVQRSFATDEFLHAGAAAKDWFTIPPEVRERFKQLATDEGQDGVRMLAALDRVAARLNSILARTDIDDSAKKSLLSSLLSTGTGEYDNNPEAVGSDGFGANAGRLGPVLAELLGGDGAMLFDGDDLDAESVEAMARDMEHALGSWMKDNEIPIKADTSREYLAGLRASAEENRRRRSDYSIADTVADIMRTRHERLEASRQRATAPRGDGGGAA